MKHSDLRGILRYIPKFRRKIFVVSVDGGMVEDDNFGNLIATRDGGETWRLLAEGTGPGYRSCIVHHPRNSQQVVASGFQGVDVSLDGGTTWRHVSDSSRYVARFSPSGRTLWLAGKRSLSRVSWDAISLP